MKRRLIEVIKGEKGQVLPVVLVLMLIGGLLIAPSLSYATTSLNVGQIVEKKVRGLYAADAGIEDALWRLKKDLSISELYHLPEEEPVNQMQVTIETEDKGIYALYFGDLIVVGESPQEHYDWLTVDGEMVWDELEEAYKYTITVTWQPKAGEEGTPTIKLEEVGVRLPLGYSYQSGSAASFANNLSTKKPDDRLDGAGAQMLNWEFGSPRPRVTEGDPTATQTFYVTGEEGEPEGDYSWVEAQQPSIGIVGEVVGNVYRIKATATSDSGSSTTIETYVLVSSDDYTIIDGNFTLDKDATITGNIYVKGKVRLKEDATFTGNIWAQEDVDLDEEARINGNICAGGDVELDEEARINGNVYAGGDVELDEDARINGNVYAGGDVDLDDDARITGDYDLPYEGCGLSLSGSLQILSWEIN